MTQYYVGLVLGVGNGVLWTLVILGLTGSLNW
jgi:hypothetical protein